MAFVHMKLLNAAVSQSTQHSDAADAEQNLLRQPIPLIAAVKVICQRAVTVSVAFNVCIEQNQRHNIAARPNNVVLPGSRLNRSTLDLHLNRLRQRQQESR